MIEMEDLYREQRARMTRRAEESRDLPDGMTYASSFDASHYLRSAWGAISRILGAR